MAATVPHILLSRALLGTLRMSWDQVSLLYTKTVTSRPSEGWTRLNCSPRILLFGTFSLFHHPRKCDDAREKSVVFPQRFFGDFRVNCRSLFPMFSSGEHLGNMTNDYGDALSGFLSRFNMPWLQGKFSPQKACVFRIKGNVEEAVR